MTHAFLLYNYEEVVQLFKDNLEIMPEVAHLHICTFALFANLRS